MKLKISQPLSSSLTHISALLGIRPDRLADQLLQDALCGRLEAGRSAFLAQLAMMARYDSRDAAEGVCARLEERAVSESLAGSSPFTIATEILESPEGYGIWAELLHPNHEGWQGAIPTE
jgi:hypothetical protein